jgi:hypothetical protein
MWFVRFVNVLAFVESASANEGLQTCVVKWNMCRSCEDIHWNMRSHDAVASSWMKMQMHKRVTFKEVPAKWTQVVNWINDVGC